MELRSSTLASLALAATIALTSLPSQAQVSPGSTSPAEGAVDAAVKGCQRLKINFSTLEAPSSFETALLGNWNFKLCAKALKGVGLTASVLGALDTFAGSAHAADGVPPPSNPFGGDF